VSGLRPETAVSSVKLTRALAATDNPLVDPTTGDIHHGGNFQAGLTLG
jgi:histidine ammonia-lyase